MKGRIALSALPRAAVEADVSSLTDGLSAVPDTGPLAGLRADWARVLDASHRLP